MRKLLLSIMSVGMVAMAVACSTEPRNQSQRQALQESAKATLTSMEAKDSGLANVVDNAYGYVIFPDVGKGGFIIGGAWGRGVVYEQGRMVGYASVSEGSVGVTAGGQTYSELIIFKDQDAFRHFQDGGWTIGAEASVVALKAGAAAAAEFRNGVMVFINNQGGLMADASLKGQKVNFHPSSEADNQQ